MKRGSYLPEWSTQTTQYNVTSHASNNGMTKSGRQIQKHDDGRKESDSSRVKSTQI